MPKPLSQQFLAGQVQTMILAVLQDGPSYGYQIVQDLNARAPHLLNFGEGTVYPLLHRLEERGLLVADWRKAQSGRKRKYYRLTERGHGALAEGSSQWKKMVEAMERVLDSPPDLPAPKPSQS